MLDTIIGQVVNYCIMTMLFVGLLGYVLKDSYKREKKYQKTLDKLADCLRVVDEIRKDVTEIKTKVEYSDKQSKKK